MNETPIGWLNGTGNLANWLRVFGTAAAMVAAGAVAWTVLTSRVEASEHGLETQRAEIRGQAAELRAHDERLRSLESGQRDFLWMLHEMCIRQAQQMRIADSHCRRPDSR